MRSSRVAAVSRLLWKGSDRECKFASTMVKRAPTKISVEGINFTKPTGDVVKGVKASGAWRYPGGIIQRAPTTQLGNDGKHYYDDKDPGEARRKHESNFFITLNTNRCVGERYVTPQQAADGKRAMRKALDFLSKDSSICTFMKFGPKSAHYREDKFEDVITKVEWQAAVEVGEQLERLHCHIWLTVHHYSQVQVNMPVMQRMFKQAYNSHVGAENLRVLRCNKMPYIQVKLLPTSDWAMVMKQYIHKGMQFSE